MVLELEGKVIIWEGGSCDHLGGGGGEGGRGASPVPTLLIDETKRA